MPDISEEKVVELLAEIRGATPESKLRKGVEAIIKDDAEKARVKIETEKKLAEKVKAAADKIREEELDSTDKTPPEVPKRDDKGKFKKKEPDTPEGIEDKPEDRIKELTEQLKTMTKEIDALKKRKNYRTKPPPAEVVDEVDDFIKQNITKDFEVII